MILLALQRTWSASVLGRLDKNFSVVKRYRHFLQTEYLLQVPLLRLQTNR